MNTTRRTTLTSERGDTRDRIVDAAIAAMVAKSYNGVGLNEILQAANVPKGSFYYFFKSKEHLGIGVIETSAAAHLERLREFFEDTSISPLGRLRAFFESVREEAANRETRKECVFCKFALEQADLSEPMKRAIRSSMEQFQGLTAQLLREAQAVGEIGPQFDPDRLAEFLHTTFDGVMIRVHVANDVRAIDTYLEHLFGMLLK